MATKTKKPAAKKSAAEKSAAKKPAAKKPAAKKPAVKKPAAKRSKSAGSPFLQAGEELRDYAMSFPEATEDFPWGDRVVKVRKKVFVFLGVPGKDGLSLSTKLPRSAAAALMTPFAKPTGYGLGKSGWVTSSFEGDDEVPVPILKQWIAESYQAVAPKTLLSKLPSPGSGAGDAD